MDVGQEPVRQLLKWPAVVVDPEATLRKVAATLASQYIGVAVVRSERGSGNDEGVISERDIVRALAEGLDPDFERARDVMTADFSAVAPDDSVLSVAQSMVDNEIRHLPVTEAGRVVGVVSERDALRLFVTAYGSSASRDEDASQS
jgi:CBS domain-containing protein